MSAPAADPAGDRSTVVNLPAPQVAAQTAAFLDEVDEQLVAAMRNLLHTWRVDLARPLGAASRPSPPVDILLDHDLPEMLQALHRTGGKRIRPSMTFWGWVAAGGRSTGTGVEAVARAGAALELLHIFALIHDDVMDESDSRRGQPSVHTLAAQLHLHSGARGNARRFGESIAVLVGDLAHAEADHLVTELPRPMREIWRLLVIELVHGQSRDLTGSAAGRRDLDHARSVARMKSGCYTVQRPLQLGAAAAEADEAVTEVLDRYGEEVGEAFALRDDLLSGKPTVIMALAHDRLFGPARKVLRRVGTPELSPADVVFLQEALAEHGVVDAVESLIRNRVHTAVDALRSGPLDPAGVAGLTSMAHRIAWRDR